MIGLLYNVARKLAVVFPMSNEPGNHGVVVTAIASHDWILAGPIWSSSAVIFSAWSLDAISGTTPPYC